PARCSGGLWARFRRRRLTRCSRSSSRTGRRSCVLAARVLPIDDDPFVAAIERVATRFTSAGRPQPLAQYQKDPVGFFRDVLGVPEHTIRWSMNPGYERHRWDGTPDPLVVIAESLAAWKNVGVESGTG